MLRTLQNIFGVRPYLGDAANAPDLSDLFSVTNPPSIQLVRPRWANGVFGCIITNLAPGKSFIVEGSSNRTGWLPIKTNTSSSTSASFSDRPTNSTHRFYRAKEAP